VMSPSPPDFTEFPDGASRPCLTCRGSIPEWPKSSLKDYETPREATLGLEQYLVFYNGQRLHQALDYQTPAAVYFGS